MRCRYLNTNYICGKKFKKKFQNLAKFFFLKLSFFIFPEILFNISYFILLVVRSVKVSGKLLNFPGKFPMNDWVHWFHYVVRITSSTNWKGASSIPSIPIFDYLSSILFGANVFYRILVLRISLALKNIKILHWAAILKISSSICIKFNGTKKNWKFCCASAWGLKIGHIINKMFWIPRHTLIWIW